MQMLEYENQMFLDLLHEDGLLVAAKGLGIEQVFLNLLKVYCDPGNLVLVLGTYSKEEEHFISQLSREGVKCLPRSITTDCGPVERQTIYMQAGVLFVTPRILVVDMLKNRVPKDLITGFLVYRAHRIIESCQEAFILRLYRQHNKTGFVKALSSTPHSFTVGFCQVTRVMKSLFVPNLYLWPRFHATVTSSLEKCIPEVVELQLRMTPAMLSIQTAVLDLINFTLKEVRRCNPSLDTEELTTENAISKSFHRILQMQLDPIWHQLSARTKQLVSDLRTLRTVLSYLTRYDCVTFYRMVSSLGTTEEAHKNSGWMLLGSAETLFAQAKARVFGKPGSESSQPSLEVNPKWLALSEVLAEIKVEMKEEVPQPKILIVAEDSHSCQQLKKYLSQGAQEVLKGMYEKVTEVKKTEPSKKRAEKKKGSVEAVRKKLCKDQNTLTQMVRSKSEITEEDDDQESDIAQVAETCDSSVVIAPFKCANDASSVDKKLLETEPRYIVLYDAEVGFIRQLEVYQAHKPNLHVKVYFMIYSGSVEEQAYLTSLRREKEAFEHLIKEKATMVVPEEQKGLLEDHPALTRDPRKANEMVGGNTSTRRGGTGEENLQRKVLVDMREFRSELPSLIHRRKIDIEPVTLDIGDYILTPEICVERKSISDLVGSLISGRLYNQSLAMTRNYGQPILLIEFDHTKSFALQGKYYLSNDVPVNDITARLQLLTLHFPKLRTVWSPSPYATAELFDELKRGAEEPDASKVPLIRPEFGDSAEGKYNTTIHDFMLKFPGVNSKNINALLSKGISLDHLSMLSFDELNAVLGNSVNAQALWRAFHELLQQDNMSSLRTKEKKIGKHSKSKEKK